MSEHRELQVIVMRVQRFDLEPKAFAGLPVAVNMGKVIGFIPVYKNEEDARSEFPEGPFEYIGEVGDESP